MHRHKKLFRLLTIISVFALAIILGSCSNSNNSSSDDQDNSNYNANDPSEYVKAHPGAKLVYGRNADQNQPSGRVYYPKQIKSYLAKVQKKDSKYISKLYFDTKNKDDQNVVVVYLTPVAIHKFESPDSPSKNGLEKGTGGTVSEYSFSNTLNYQLVGLDKYLPQYRGDRVGVKIANHNMTNDNNSVK